jgi:hypothetical protein
MKRTSVAFLGVAFAIACLASAFSARPAKALTSGKTYDLKYGLKEGARFEIKTARTDDAETDMMGSKMLSRTESTGDYSFTVKKAERGSMVLDVTYVGKTLIVQSPAETTSVDFSGLFGKTATMTLSVDGTASDFKGFDLLPAIDIVSQQTKIDAPRYILELKDLFPRLPGKPVAAGDTWTSMEVYKEPMPAGGSDSLTVTLKENYTLVGPAKKDGLDCLEIKDDLTMSVAGSGTAQGMSLTIDMLGSGTSTIYFVPSKGMYISDDGDSTIKGSAVVQEAAVTIPMSHVYKATSTVTF